MFDAVLLFGASILSGAIGAMMGVGGGIVLIPVMTGFLGMPVHLAVAASLVSIVANSGTASASFLRAGYTNLRLAILLSTVSVVGSFAGVAIGKIAGGRLVTGTFAGLLALALWTTWLSRSDRPLPPGAGDPWESRLGLTGLMPAADGSHTAYGVRKIGTGMALLVLAGLSSGMLGVGGGLVQVPVMDRLMRLPIKATMATSNFILGVTAAAGALAYLVMGDVNPTVAAPVTLGVVVGARLGAAGMKKIPSGTLRILFAALLGVMLVQMIVRTVNG